ncbi:hypothetical protein [Microbacterium sp. NC79]|uniref:hypothetical protein n=1 Tax=Microbacterium sp. NC79 TaxID=2851009 RepID=UPI001C2B81DB|nr:hypothetical protein [Microbacterium sp. NC79]MBV0895033.1 hypothetical protein [Microbacterium sp. NC79]
MIAALLLLTIAIADLTMLVWQSARTRPLAVGVMVVALVGWPIVLIAGFSAPWWVALTFVVVAALWALALASRWAARLVIPVGLLLAAALAALLLVPTLATLVQPSWADAWAATGAVISPTVATMAVAVAVFLAHSANVIVRATLTLARRADTHTAERSTEPEVSAGSWIVAGKWRWARVQVMPPEPAAPRVISTMRGGRWIGPLERWAIVALGLAGALGIIAAIMAGKGIVRFPEINADRGIGSKAEEFLVGSLLSWSLAGCGIALIVGAATVAG